VIYFLMLILSIEFPELPVNVINPSPSLAKKVTEKANSLPSLTIEKADVQLMLSPSSDELM
uniref:hypothetical protein n=1 Tax=Raoultella ornithinolytica TaxID=54291 RepID=UPI00384EF2B4